MEQDVRTTVDELLKAISTKNVIAEPMEVGDNVLITIARVGLGFGTGAGQGTGDRGVSGNGRGAGGAAGVSPVALIIVHKSLKGPEGVEVKSLAPPSYVGKAIGEIATSLMGHLAESKPKTEKKE
jgi:uncharacterized spore protein YtfJ